MSKQTQKQNKKLGAWGEKVAKKYLLDKFPNIQFIQSNYHAPGGEIDLIFKEKTQDFWYFIEVKTRKNKHFGDINESINTTKIKKIIRAIAHYFFITQKQDFIPDYQIDAILLEIENKKVFCQHLDNLGLENF